MVRTNYTTLADDFHLKILLCSDVKRLDGISHICKTRSETRHHLLNLGIWLCVKGVYDIAKEPCGI